MIIGSLNKYRPTGIMNGQSRVKQNSGVGSYKHFSPKFEHGRVSGMHFYQVFVKPLLNFANFLTRVKCLNQSRFVLAKVEDAAL